MKTIDAHIHLDRYNDNEIERILEDSRWLEAVVSVSWDLESCKRNLELSKKYKQVKPAFASIRSKACSQNRSLPS